MNAFFLTINQDGLPFSQSIAEKMMSALDVFGPDIKTLHVKENFAIGFQAQCYSSEQKRNQQCIVNDKKDWFLFDGRIDNRDALFQSLSMPYDSSLSDVQLMVIAYQRYGETCVEKVVGPFVFVHFNPDRNRLVALLDPMGGRYLVYAECAGVFMLATWEGAICAHPEFDAQHDESKLSHVLGFMATPQPRGYIKNIQTVKPGHQLVFESSSVVQTLVYLPDPTRRIRLSSQEDYAAEFRRLLDQSVQRRLPASGAVGVMLSGGLDSVPIAISAARSPALSVTKRSAIKSNDRLHAFSWSFSEHVELNETNYSSKICQELGIEQHLLDCDQLWPCPLSDFDLNPVVPINTPYGIKHQAMLQLAQQQQVSTLLSGYAGDVLYSGTHSILLELLASGQFSSFMHECRTRFANVNSLRAFVANYFVKPLLVKKNFNRLMLNKYGNKHHTKVDYLSDYANNQLISEKHWLSERASEALRPQQYVNALDHSIGENLAQARYFDALYRVQKVYPFRDRDLVEFMLAIPSRELFFNAQIRPIVKHAFATELSAELAQRNDKTSFYSFLQAGLVKDNAYESLLSDDNELWSKYINDCKLIADDTVQTPADLLKWVCAYYQYWHNNTA